jgi:hypothetical protein
MRYNPATDRALYTIDEIAEQCRNAILNAEASARFCEGVYDEILTFYRWEDDVLRLIPEPCAA